MKIKFGNLWSTKEDKAVVSEILYNIAIALQQFDVKIEKLEKRIASLESKPPEITLNHTRSDFEGTDATEVPTGENESSGEALK